MATLTLAPNGAGAETAIPNLVGAATHWQAVLTNDGDTSYVEVPDVDDTWYRDLYALEDSADLGVISNVTVYAVGRIGQPLMGYSSGIIFLSVRTHGSVYEIQHPTGLPSNAYGSVSNAWATNPDTGDAWTWAEINALQAGVYLRRSHKFVPAAPRWARVTQVYIVVTHTAAVPTVTTQAVTSISGTIATGNGNIVSVGGDSVTEHGHCWNTTGTPTTSGSKTINGAGAVGAFTSAITGLTAGTKYYVRAYATNSGGTAYGGEVVFWADKGTVHPSDDVARVSSIRHIFRPGFFRMQAGLGDLGFDVDVAETAVKAELDTARDSFKERMETTAKQLQEEAGMSREESLRIARKLETLEDIAREPIGPIPTVKPTAPPPRFPGYEAQIEYEEWFQKQMKELREMGWEG